MSLEYEPAPEPQISNFGSVTLFSSGGKYGLAADLLFFFSTLKPRVE